MSHCPCLSPHWMAGVCKQMCCRYCELLFHASHWFYVHKCWDWIMPLRSSTSHFLAVVCLFFLVAAAAAALDESSLYFSFTSVTAWGVPHVCECLWAVVDCRPGVWQSHGTDYSTRPHDTNRVCFSKVTYSHGALFFPDIRVLFESMFKSCDIGEFPKIH